MGSEGYGPQPTVVSNELQDLQSLIVPSQVGMKAFSTDPHQIGGNIAPTTGVLYGSMVDVPRTQTFGSVVLYTGTLGAGPLTASQCYVGVTTDATPGTVLGKSAATAVEASTILAVGRVDIAIAEIAAGNLTVTGGEGISVVAFMLLVGSGIPQMTRINTSTPLALLNSGPKKRYRQSSGPYTAVPSPTIPWANTPAAGFWMGLN